jgi:hypothetical protein
LAERVRGHAVLVGNRAVLEGFAAGATAPAFEPEEFEREEARRYRFNLLMALVAEAIPRRLGADADSHALARDKKLARKVANAYRVTLMRAAQLDGAVAVPDLSSREVRMRLARSAGNGERRLGATVRWEVWIPETIEDVRLRRTEIAALGLERGTVRWSWKRVRVLSEEIDNLERIGNELVRKNDGTRNGRASRARGRPARGD